MVRIHFDSLKAVYIVGDPASSPRYETSVRRLSTCSYAEDGDIVSAGGGTTEKFVTHWRWFWCTGGNWRQFGEVSCLPFVLIFCSFTDSSQKSNTTSVFISHLSSHNAVVRMQKFDNALSCSPYL